MKLSTRKRLTEAGWFFVLAGLLTLLMGAAVVRLDASKKRTESLRVNVERKLEALRNRDLMGRDEEALERTEAALAEWKERAARQADRIATISTAARRAGVTLISLRDLDAETSADGLLASYSHSVNGAGDARQIGGFLDALYEGPGMVGVEDLEVYRDEEAEPGRLLASMRVTWLAPGTPETPETPDDTPEEAPR